MWKFLSRLFMVFGAIIFIGSFIFLWAYFWGYLKADLVGQLILRFLLQVIMGAFLYFLGDLMIRVQTEHDTFERFFGKYAKKERKFMKSLFGNSIE